ncbi:MAG TPA: RHS repeat-associated core domain-containing protein, partial [Acidimicrobiales bacterium]|nr:RHS repeat-associated core domain-containing protein [Acidimicrobiales bacterium]
YHDTETGYIYLRARHYDPTTGQFTSQDPIVAITEEPYGYARGDVVNSGDPTGLASYRYTFDLGNNLDNVPISLLVHNVRAGCDRLFPISGCVSGFEIGDVMPLEQSVFGAYRQGFPVMVMAIGASSFTFVALSGHPEGEGRAITFRFWQKEVCGSDGRKTRRTLMTVSTSSSGSPIVTLPLIRQLNFLFARGTWARFAANIASDDIYEDWA